jgi:hypothetical protein
VNQMALVQSETVEDREGVEVFYGEFGAIDIAAPSHRIRLTALLILLAAIISFFGCNKTAELSFTTFTSPDEAGKGLLDAAKTGNQNALLAILPRVRKT